MVSSSSVVRSLPGSGFRDFFIQSARRVGLPGGELASRTRRMRELLADLLAYTTLDVKAPDATETIDLNLVFQEVRKSMKEAIEESGAVVTSDPLPVVGSLRSKLLGVKLAFGADGGQSLCQGVLGYPLVHTRQCFEPQARSCDRLAAIVGFVGRGADLQGDIFVTADDEALRPAPG